MRRIVGRRMLSPWLLGVALAGCPGSSYDHGFDPRLDFVKDTTHVWMDAGSADFVVHFAAAIVTA